MAWSAPLVRRVTGKVGVPRLSPSPGSDRIAVNVVALVIVLAMFGVATSPFKTVVVAGLALIYVSVASSCTWLGRAMAE